MIGAIVSEYYGGALDTLGANIEQDASLFQFEKAWSEIVIACISESAFTSRSRSSSGSPRAGSHGWRWLGLE